ncbi:MAG: hypothetical protein EYC68_16730 [Chloroflexota bacterium]|nr:MAG: hypothetical protein EYC68_16730 [Chloroflexota bacterium]
MDIELPSDFQDFLKLLNVHGVEYLVVGGYAVIYHGYPRATQDLDIWIAVHSENAKRVVATLEEFGFGSPELTTDLFLKDENIVRMGIAPIRIEVTTRISGVEFQESYREKIVDDMDGIPVNIISLKDLRRNKKASGRYKDLNDLENLKPADD